MNYYNGRLPVEALAHRSWPPIQKKQYTYKKKKKVTVGMICRKGKFETWNERVKG